MKSQMKGECPFCGQIQIVDAETQEEADTKAAEQCNCDNALKRIHLLEENIDKLTGKDILRFNMEEVPEEVRDAIKTIGALCVYGDIETAGFHVADSVITIRKTKRGVSVSRKKALSATLEA